MQVAGVWYIMLIALGFSTFLTIVERLRYKFSAHKRGSASRNAGHGAEHDEAHGARHSDGAECIAEVAIPGAQTGKGAGETRCSSLIRVHVQIAGCASRNAGHGAEPDEAHGTFGPRNSDGAECIAEVAIPGAQVAKGAGEMLCSASTAAGWLKCIFSWQVVPAAMQAMAQSMMRHMAQCTATARSATREVLKGVGG
jgi:hypothetical protein